MILIQMISIKVVHWAFIIFLMKTMHEGLKSVPQGIRIPLINASKKKSPWLSAARNLVFRICRISAFFVDSRRVETVHRPWNLIQIIA